MTIVDSAIYVDGKRAQEPSTLAETHEAARGRGGVVWIGLSRPTEKEFQAVAEEFGLHELAVEDAVVAHQRPKIERYGDTLFVVLKAARYLDAPEEVDFGEVHVFVGEVSGVLLDDEPAPEVVPGLGERPRGREDLGPARRDHLQRQPGVVRQLHQRRAEL